MKETPIGYRCKRLYQSFVNPTRQCWYTCRVILVKGITQYEILSEDAPLQMVQSLELKTIALQLNALIHTAKGESRNDGVTDQELNVIGKEIDDGKEFFGLSHPVVQKAIHAHIHNAYVEARSKLPRVNSYNNVGSIYPQLFGSIPFSQFNLMPQYYQAAPIRTLQQQQQQQQQQLLNLARAAVFTANPRVAAPVILQARMPPPPGTSLLMSIPSAATASPASIATIPMQQQPQPSAIAPILAPGMVPSIAPSLAPAMAPAPAMIAPTVPGSQSQMNLPSLFSVKAP